MRMHRTAALLRACGLGVVILGVFLAWSDESTEEEAPAPEEVEPTDSAEPPSTAEPAEPAARVEPVPADLEEVYPPKYPPHRVLLLGDGLVIDELAVVLSEALVAKGEVEVLLAQPAEVGLAAPGALNWELLVGGLLEKHAPDVVVFAGGHHDWQKPRDRRGRAGRSLDGEPERDSAAEYARRASSVLGVLAGPGRLLFVAGAAPPAAKQRRASARHDWVDEGLRAACEAAQGCTFLPEAWQSEDVAEVAARISAGLETRLSWTPEPIPEAPPPPERWDEDGNLLLPAAFSEDNLISHPSAARGRDVSYWAFVPRPEREGELFPVLYLLHGAWGSHNDWRDHAAPQLRDLSQRFGVVIITPNGDEFGWYLDSPQDPESQLETYFLRELIPHVEGEARLPVMAGPEHRAIAGLSMGGHGAFVLSLRNPGTFVSASSMSGILDITTHPNSWHIQDRLGPLRSSEAAWQAHSATWLLREQPDDLGGLKLLFTVSTEDSAAYAENAALHAELEERGLLHEYAEAPGGHTWAYWTSVIEDHVAFHGEWLSGDGVR